MNRQYLHMIIATTICVMQHFASADVVFDDGQQHTIDYGITERVKVCDSTETGIPTAVCISPGASLGSLVSICGNSSLEMNGGYLQAGGDLEGHSAATISGGTIDGVLFAGGNSHLTLQDAADVDGICLLGNATAIIDGGTYGGLTTRSIADMSMSILIHGGTFTSGLGIDSSVTIDIADGTFRTGFSSDARSLSITGGNFETALMLGGSTTVSGGSFSGEFAITHPESSLTFVGDNFAVNGTPIEALTDRFLGMSQTTFNGFNCYSGIVTGTLADGTPLNQFVYLVDEGYPIENPYGTLHFIPEPASLALVAIGGGWVMRRRRRA